MIFKANAHVQLLNSLATVFSVSFQILPKNDYFRSGVFAKTMAMIPKILAAAKIVKAV